MPSVQPRMTDVQYRDLQLAREQLHLDRIDAEARILDLQLEYAHAPSRAASRTDYSRAAPHHGLGTEQSIPVNFGDATTQQNIPPQPAHSTPPHLPRGVLPVSFEQRQIAPSLQVFTPRVKLNQPKYNGESSPTTQKTIFKSISAWLKSSGCDGDQ